MRPTPLSLRDGHAHFSKVVRRFVGAALSVAHPNAWRRRRSTRGRKLPRRRGLKCDASLGRSDRDYSLGDRLDRTAWLARRWSDWLSTSLRVSGLMWGNIDGADPRLNPNMVPTANPNLRGGERVGLSYGVNLLLPAFLPGLEGHRLALEIA